MEWLVIVLLVAVVYAYFQLRRIPADLSILPEQFVVIDLETTGLDPTKHEIIEIGAVKVNRDSDNHTTFQVFVKPTKKIPKKITELTSITQEMVEKDGVALESAMADLVSFIGGLRLVAYNAEFDMGFLRNAAARSGVVIDNPVSCALKMARRAWPGLKSYRLGDVSNPLGRPTDGGAHRALHDCTLTVTVYAAAASKLRSVS